MKYEKGCLFIGGPRDGDRIATNLRRLMVPVAVPGSMNYSCVEYERMEISGEVAVYYVYVPAGAKADFALCRLIDCYDANKEPS